LIALEVMFIMPISSMIFTWRHPCIFNVKHLKIELSILKPQRICSGRNRHLVAHLYVIKHILQMIRSLCSIRKAALFWRLELVLTLAFSFMIARLTTGSALFLTQCITTDINIHKTLGNSPQTSSDTYAFVVNACPLGSSPFGALCWKLLPWLYA